MDILMDKVWQMLSAEKTLPMHTRLFRLICVSIFFLSFLIVLPVNIFIEDDLPVVLDVLTVLLGITAGVVFAFSLRGRDFIKIFMVVGLLLLDIGWFYNGGFSGSVAYYYFVAFTVPLVLCRKQARIILCSYVAFNIIVVMLIAYSNPNLVTPFKDMSSEVIDQISGIIACSSGLFLVLWVVTTSYDREHQAEKLASSLLSASELNYRGVVEQAKCVFMRLTSDGKISFVNKFGEKLFGRQREELVGKPLLLLMNMAEDEAIIQEQLSKFLSPIPSYVLEVEHCSGKGGAVWLAWQCQEIKDGFGKTMEILCIGADITMQREQTAEVQRMQKLESLGLLAGGIAHDFNNLLTAIMGYASVAKTYSDNAEVQKYMLSIEKSTEHAKELTTQLLTFAKGGQPIKEVISLKSLLENSLSLALHGKACKGVSNIEDAIWPVLADGAQLTQVFNNLILNASQAMSNGGIITVNAKNIENNARWVEISIVDQGCGIPKENLERIFDPYFTTKKTGTGLGLAVVHSIVLQHNGAVKVKSIEGEGTTFTVRLPASQITAPAIPNVNIESMPSGNHERILLMDDEEYIRELATIILEQAGFSVLTVADGSEAVTKYTEALASQKPFDLLITDLTVPGGMGGLEAVRQLKVIDPNINAIVSSGYSSDMASVMALGFQGIIQKPYTNEQLLKAVHDALRNFKTKT